MICPRNSCGEFFLVVFGLTSVFRSLKWILECCYLIHEITGFFPIFLWIEGTNVGFLAEKLLKNCFSSLLIL